MCLGEYEVDERVKRLPPCGHEFHEACIDLWLTNHVTCPMCRCSLLPPQVLSALRNTHPPYLASELVMPHFRSSSKLLNHVPMISTAVHSKNMVR